MIETNDTNIYHSHIEIKKVQNEGKFYHADVNF